MKTRLFRNRTFEFIQTSQQVTAVCQTIIFYNRGTNPFFVSNFEVLPNTQLMFAGQFFDEIDQTLYDLVFLNNFNVANNNCVVCREFITSEC